MEEFFYMVTLYHPTLYTLEYMNTVFRRSLSPISGLVTNDMDFHGSILRIPAIHKKQEGGACLNIIHRDNLRQYATGVGHNHFAYISFTT